MNVCRVKPFERNTRAMVAGDDATLVVNGGAAVVASGGGVNTTSWIERFCRRRGHELFAIVSRHFIADKFNLVGLCELVPHFKLALNSILDHLCDSQWPSVDDDTVYEAAWMLYGLVHARFILTEPGMAQMLSKFSSGVFGQCPRTYCLNQQLLPIGLSTQPGEAMIKFFCPKCSDVYNARSHRHHAVDGAYFGPDFPHMLFMTHPEVRVKKSAYIFKPRLFGFKIHPLADQLTEPDVSTDCNERSLSWT